MPEGQVGQVLFFDVIEEEPQPFDEWVIKARAEEDRQGTGEPDLSEPEWREAHQEYLEAFQPWRSVLLVEGNHEALFRSTERYHTERACRAAGAMAFGPQATVFERRAEHGLNLLRRGREATPEEQE